MTTLEPGANDVFTHGLLCSPRSTALRASSPARTITNGLDVLVHDVIAATTTAPWSSSKSSPSTDTRAGLLARSPDCVVGAPAGSSCAPSELTAGGSLAGTDSFDASLALLPLPLSFTYDFSAWRKLSFALSSDTRSCGRLGPASDGTTVERSSSSRSL